MVETDPRVQQQDNPFYSEASMQKLFFGFVGSMEAPYLDFPTTFKPTREVEYETLYELRRQQNYSRSSSNQ